MSEATPSGSAAEQPGNRFVPDAATADRLHKADLYAYGSMFDAAGPRLGAGCARIEASGPWAPYSFASSRATGAGT